MYMLLSSTPPQLVIAAGECACNGARYDKRYTIDEPTVTYLAERVEALLQLTEERCNEKIAALKKIAAG